MRLLTDRRAQSIQVGAVLLFGILVIGLSLYQAFVVPDQNQEVEFNHNQELQQEMTELRSTVISMPESATTRSVSVGLGVQYPSRSIFVNPGPASGTLRTVETRNESVAFVIDNATADGATGSFWDGTPRSYNTGFLEYRPNYNHYSSAPRTIYEHSVLFNSFEREEQTLPLTDQTVVDGNRISLIALNGSVSENRVGSTSVDVKPVSTQTRTVEVESTNAEPLTLVLPTRLDVAKWEELLADEQRVVSVTGGDGTVRIQFEAGTYRLQLANVGVGTRIRVPGPAYLTDDPNDVDRLEEGETDTVAVEVRDAFNRPLSNVTVHAAADNGDLASNTTRTDRDGTATFEYTAPGGVEEAHVNLSIRGEIDAIDHDPDNPEDVTVSIEVSEARGDGGGTYELEFEPGRIAEQNGIDCDEDEGECTMILGASQELYVSTAPSVAGATVDFSLGTPLLASVDPSSNETDSTGETQTTITSTDNTEAGDSVIVHANSAGDGDTLVVVFESGVFYDVEIDESETDTAVSQGGRADIVATIENQGDEDGLQDVDLEIVDDTGTVVHEDAVEDLAIDAGDAEQVVFEWQTNETAPGEYTAIVSSDDDADSTTVTVFSALYPDECNLIQGDFEGCENMQAADGTVATFSGTGIVSFEVDVITESVPAGDYSLELGVENVKLGGQSDGVHVIVTDDAGNELGATTLTTNDNNEIVTVDLDPLQADGVITVKYEADWHPDELELDYQRLVSSE